MRERCKIPEFSNLFAEPCVPYADQWKEDIVVVGYSQLYRGSETPKLIELKPNFQLYKGLISVVLGPLPLRPLFI